MTPPVRIGVWGVGTWGEKHVRVLAGLPEAELVGVHDRDPARAQAVAARHGVRAFTAPETLLEACEAVTVATPTVAHCEAVELALGAGRHVLVEKPMAVTLDEAQAMISAARRAGVRLEVGHVERFNPAWLAARPHLGAPKFIEIHRLAAFQPRSLDVDVVFDLMIHDLDLVLSLTGCAPSRLSAVGVAVLSDNVDIANVRLEFPDGCVANLTASRVSVERLRRVRFFQANAYVSVDLFEKSGEAFVIEDPAAFRAPHADPLLRLKGIRRTALEVGPGEPLALELAGFLAGVRGKGPGAASAEAGRDALAIAGQVRDAIQQRAERWNLESPAPS